MRTKGEQLAWLDNDVQVLETLFGNPSEDGKSVIVPPEYMPDKKQFSVSLEGVGELTGELRLRLVQLVREQYNAREAEQEAEAISRAESRKGDTAGGRTSPGDGAGGAAAAASSVPTGQVGMENYLKTEISRLCGLRQHLTNESVAAAEGLRAIEANLASCEQDLDIATKLLEDYQCMKGLPEESPPSPAKEKQAKA